MINFLEMMRQKSSKIYVTHLMKSHQEIDVIDMLHQSRWKKNCISKEKLIQSIEDTTLEMEQAHISFIFWVSNEKRLSIKYSIAIRDKVKLLKYSCLKY